MSTNTSANARKRLLTTEIRLSSIYVFGMTCPDCDSPLVAFVVPPELHEYVPDRETTLAICPRCLQLQPTKLGANSEQTPDFSRISDSFPTGEAAVPMALMLGLLDSLALHRSEIESLLERVERSGVDPLLLIDRLAVQGSVKPRWDVKRRRHQLEQFLE